jgi:ABC-type lipoprotein export system ATPase subunit
MELMSELNRKGTTIIMVTHDPNIAKYSHRTIHIADGRIVE